MTETFDFDATKSGKILNSWGIFTASTGATACKTGRNTGNTKWRAFFCFDTSVLPSDAVVSKVEFRQILSDVQPEGTPDNLAIKYSLGTFIGDALDGNAEEWAAGTYVHRESTEQDDVWLDLSNQADPVGLVNLAGDTDLKIWDDSTQGAGDSSWGTDFNGKNLCQLRVTYARTHAHADHIVGVGVENRVAKVGAEDRTVLTDAENRTVPVPAEEPEN